MRARILSPHPDDAALCLGGWLETLKEHDRSVLSDTELITVFGRSVYAPYAEVPSDTNRVAAVSDLRAREEREFAASLGLRLRILNLPDSSVLGLSDEEEMTADPDLDPRRRQVHSAVSGLGDQIDVLLVCAALGGHVDHRLLRDAALAATHASLVLFYEDLPYAAEMQPPVEPAPAAVSSRLAEYRVEIGGVRDEKRRQLRIYRSQLSSEDVESALAYASSLGPPGAQERMWCSSPDERATQWLRRVGVEPFAADAGRNSP